MFISVHNNQLKRVCLVLDTISRSEIKLLSSLEIKYFPILHRYPKVTKVKYKVDRSKINYA